MIYPTADSVDSSPSKPSPMLEDPRKYLQRKREKVLKKKHKYGFLIIGKQVSFCKRYQWIMLVP